MVIKPTKELPFSGTGRDARPKSTVLGWFPWEYELFLGCLLVVFQVLFRVVSDRLMIQNDFAPSLFGAGSDEEGFLEAIFDGS